MAARGGEEGWAQGCGVAAADCEPQASSTQRIHWHPPPSTRLPSVLAHHFSLALSGCPAISSSPTFRHSLCAAGNRGVGGRRTRSGLGRRRKSAGGATETAHARSGRCGAPATHPTHACAAWTRVGWGARRPASPRRRAAGIAAPPRRRGWAAASGGSGWAGRRARAGPHRRCSGGWVLQVDLVGGWRSCVCKAGRQGGGMLPRGPAPAGRAAPALASAKGRGRGLGPRRHRLLEVLKPCGGWPAAGVGAWAVERRRPEVGAARRRRTGGDATCGLCAFRAPRLCPARHPA